ncbi:MAG: cold-shock protein [Acidimicrobiia bacterium]|nr:cold-shock protein [Acidimicrobiia bacterium]
MTETRTPTGPTIGTVASFDEQSGLGVVLSSDGSRYGFHCVQIADGSRTIDVGTRVSFNVVPGLLGTWEAADIAPDLTP